MEGVTLLGVVTAIAAITGPAIAVWITRMSDDKKEVRGRRMDIFRTLMRTRKMPIHFDHVGALNLIEIEFSGDPKVIAAWKEYLKNLNLPYPSAAPDNARNLFVQTRENLLTKLISEMSKVLKFKVEQLDILEGNYLPRGWDDDENENRMVKRSLIEVFSGRRPILFQPYHPDQPHGPYPPAPKAPEQGD